MLSSFFAKHLNLYQQICKLRCFEILIKSWQATNLFFNQNCLQFSSKFSSKRSHFLRNPIKKNFRGKLTWITLSMSVVFWKSYSNEKWICPTFSVASELSMYMSTIDTLRFCRDQSSIRLFHAGIMLSKPYCCIIFVLVYCGATWVTLGAWTSWRFNLCTRWPFKKR